jgi:hypothetical protein
MNITINDKEYDAETFTDEQKYLVRQLQALDQKRSNIFFELDQVEASKIVFVEKLTSSLKEEEEE